MWKIPYHLEESIEINAPLPTVWENVIYFHNMKKWSPRLILDKDCKVHILGTDGTLDSKYMWKSEFLGVGEEYHTEIIPHKEIKSIIEFYKPFRNTSLAQFRFEQTNTQTKITWSMQAGVPFFLFFLKGMICTMIKRDFARGLKMLKKLSETGELFTQSEVYKNAHFNGFYWLGIKNNSSIEDIGINLSKDYANLEAVCRKKEIALQERIIFYTEKSDMNAGYLEYIASFQISKEDFEKVQEEGDLIKGHSPGSFGLKIIHHGSYEFLSNSWTLGFSAMRTFKLKPNKRLLPFEIYKNTPQDTPEKELITEIYLPLK